MPKNATLGIPAADTQLTGLYDFAAYKSLIATVAHPGRDIEFARSLMKEMKAKDQYSPSSATCACMKDAAIGIVTASQYFMSKAVDTRDVTMWILLRDALVGSMRLLTMPRYRVSESTDVYTLVYSTATMIDTMGRLADVACALTFVKSDPKEEAKRVSTIFMDILCGRGSAWLAYIDDMGTVAACLQERSWVTIRDTYASRRCDECVKTVAAALECGREGANKAWISAVLGLTEQFDKHQTDCMRRDMGKILVNLEVDDIVRCMRPDVFAAVQKYMVLPEMDTSQFSGYCRTFAVSPLSCVANLPSGFEIRAMGTYQALKTQKILSRM